MKIILCADDFGYSNAVSVGILNLVKLKRLSAVSCLTNFSGWHVNAKSLLPEHDHIDIGLHFNLTQGLRLSDKKPLPSLAKLIIMTHLHLISRDWIKQELKAQFQAFIAQTGFVPDFIDGHQHIHHLPMVREVLLEFYQETFINNRPYIRCVSGQPASLKSWIIELTGARYFKKLLIKNNIPHPVSFSGIYDFATNVSYRRIFLEQLAGCEENGLMMCHPALQDNYNHDSIAHARWQEYQFFSSKEFVDICGQHFIELGKFG